MLAYVASTLLIIFLGVWLQTWNFHLGLLVTEIVFIALPAALVLLLHRRTADTAQFTIPNARQLFLSALIGICLVTSLAYMALTVHQSLGIGVPEADL